MMFANMKELNQIINKMYLEFKTKFTDAYKEFW